MHDIATILARKAGTLKKSLKDSAQIIVDKAKEKIISDKEISEEEK